MSDRLPLPENIQRLYDEGYDLRTRVLNFLKKWPTNKEGQRIAWHKSDNKHQEIVDKLTIETRRWVNAVLVEALPYILVNRDLLDIQDFSIS